MSHLTRADVTVLTDNLHPLSPSDVDWHIRIGQDFYRISGRHNSSYGSYPVSLALRADAGGWPVGADEDLAESSVVPELDHWRCIDRLLGWLSIDVEDGWCRPVNGISHRIDLPAVDIVALFSEPDRPRTCLWTVRELGAHFESFRYDEGDDYDARAEHPESVYVRQGGQLVWAACERVWLPGGDAEVRVLVDGEAVAVVRY